MARTVFAVLACATAVAAFSAPRAGAKAPVAVPKIEANPLAVAAAGLTQVVYPLVYGGILVAEPMSVTVLTLRNVLLIVLLAWAVIRTARVRTSVAVTVAAT